MVRWLTVILAAMLGALFPTQALAQAPVSPTLAPVHSYNAVALGSAPVDQHVERGPSPTVPVSAADPAVDLGSHRVLTRLGSPATSTSYDRPAQFVGILDGADGTGKNPTTTIGGARAPDGGALASSLRGVAANSGFGARTLSAAELPRYQGAPYHGLRKTGRKNPAPTNGQETLNYSLQLKSTSPRRVGVDPDAGEYVVFDQTSAGVFHGHTRAWGELDNVMQRTLIRAGMVDRRGNIR